MKAGIPIAILCCSARCVLAQDLPAATASPAAAPAAEKPKCPAGPLLKHAPPFSRWTIDYRYPDSAVPKQKSAASNSTGHDRDVRPRLTTVTKTEPIIHEETINQSGGKTQHWADIASGLQITVTPDSPTLIEATPNFNKNEFFTNYSATDFQGFDWISARNFTGLQKYQDRACMVFILNADDSASTDKSVAAAPRQPSSPVGDTEQAEPGMQPGSVAVIDLETRLPVALKIGAATRIYRFSDPPTEVQHPPADVEARFSAHREALSEMSRRPPRPF